MNYGFISDELIPEDLIFGSNDRVVHTIDVPDLNWLPYFSKGELQNVPFETMGCVSFSALNMLEGVMNYQLRNNLLSEGNVAWLTAKGYLNADGDMDCSDRFTVAISGTTSRGNTGRKVMNAIRKYGVVPEKLYPWGGATADEYRDPSRIPQSVKDVGKEFVERFDFLYEVVNANGNRFTSALRHCPVEVFIPTGCPITSGVEQACGNEVNHAVTMVDNTDPRGHYPLFDHYIRQANATGQERFIRRVAKDFKFYSSAYICTLAEKQNHMNTFVKILKDKNSASTGFYLPAINEDAIVNMALLYGKTVPRKSDGTIDWEKFVEGEFTLNA